ncbi:hypothetical protein AB6A40_007997 [Gnathostoma spinigerum]|uniref:PB1 domain-containing protein n=1 Tax=Gnathostoma spinigerum TaxID=75299 RepID=A0ABD6EN44_9BILA
MNQNGVEATTLKARFGADVRRTMLHHNQDLSYNDLVLMMQRIFKIKSSTNIILKYRDEDGDLVTLADDNDVLLALRTQPALYINVFSENGDISSQIQRLEAELEAVRDLEMKLIRSLKALNTSTEPSVFGVGGSNRPDTPNMHSDSVATIQPSLHEEVNNGRSSVPHPPAPVHDEITKLCDGQRSSEMINKVDSLVDSVQSTPKSFSLPPVPNTSTSQAQSGRGDSVTEVELNNGVLSMSPSPYGQPSVPVSQGVDVGDASREQKNSLAEAQRNLQSDMGLPSIPTPGTVQPMLQPSAPFSGPPNDGLHMNHQVFGMQPTQLSQPQPQQYGSQPLPQFPGSMQPQAFPSQPQVGGQVTNSASPAPPIQMVSRPPPTTVCAPSPVQVSAVYNHPEGPVPPTSQPPASGFSVPPMQPTSHPHIGMPVSQQQQFVTQSSQQQPQAPTPFNAYRTGTPSYGNQTPTTTPPYGAPPKSAPNTLGSIPPPTSMGASSACSAPPMVPFGTTPGVNPFARGQQAAHYIRPSFPPSGGYPQ